MSANKTTLINNENKNTQNKTVTVEENKIKEILAKLINEKFSNLKNEIISNFKNETNEKEEFKAKRLLKKEEREKYKGNKNENLSDQNLSDKEKKEKNFEEFEAKKLSKIVKIKEKRLIRIENNPERKEKILEKTNQKIEKILNKIKEKKEKINNKDNKNNKNGDKNENQEKNNNKTNKTNETNEHSIHGNVKCNGCNVFPIVGIRYKCVKCDNFDYCEKCKEKNWEEHKHPMTKLRTPRPRYGMQMNFSCRRRMENKNNSNNSNSCISPNKEKCFNKLRHLQNKDRPCKNNFSPFKRLMNNIFGNFNAFANIKSPRKNQNNDEMKNKKKQIKEILKDYNFTGKEIKSALILSKMDLWKAVNLLKNGSFAKI